MADVNGPGGTGSSDQVGESGRSYQPPRWAWWTAGVLVPLAGIVATFLTATQRPPASAQVSVELPSTTTAPASPTEVPEPSGPSASSEPPAAGGTGTAPPGDRPLRIVNELSGLCLAVPDGAGTAVVDLDQETCADGPDDVWQLRPDGRDPVGRRLHRIVNGSSGRCAAVPAGSLKAGTKVNQFECGDWRDHFWRVEHERRDTGGRDLYRVVNNKSGLCLAVVDARTESGAAVHQVPCDPSPERLWWLAPL
ncbi:RICIN domain-containing protein [Streptomyces hydrogenans]|uniref:RICIN domain-containing protein n=1 Tax=Streptomyces hydrogenans TaxID=1873719 RepID=UPI00368018E5